VSRRLICVSVSKIDFGEHCDQCDQIGQNFVKCGYFFYLGIFLHFHLNKLFQNMVYSTYITFISCWMYKFKTSNLSLDIWPQFGLYFQNWANNFVSIFWSL
jgi:hypothetical protein